MPSRPPDEGPIPSDLPVHRLADLGFVAIGQIGRGIVIVIPIDLRPAIEAELGTGLIPFCDFAA